jgi:Tol biopolymer transport system component/DNA-binding winged helix-turn-helix (wHTH) protein
LNVTFVATQPQPSARFIFGPFEVDPSREELRKGGLPIRLAGQPFQILVALLARPAELVTRAELREQIWGEGTFVDFEHSLNAAVNKLRRALNDSADNPRYIETVAGRGYRFIGSLESRGLSPSLLASRAITAIDRAADFSEAHTGGRPLFSPKDATRATRRWYWLTVAAAASAVAALLGLFYLRTSGPAPQPVRLQIPLPQDTAFSSSGGFAISPDGKKLVFSAVGKDNIARFWLRNLDSVEATPLAGSNHDAQYSSVFWSPDSRSIAMMDGGFILKKLDVNGAPPRVIATPPGAAFGGDWAPDGTTLWGNSAGIFRVDPSDTATAITSVDPARQEFAHTDPMFLPDHRHFLYTRRSAIAELNGIYVGLIDRKPNQQDLTLLLPGTSRARYVPAGDGKLVFYRSGTVLAQSFDPQRLALSGDPVPVVDQVDRSERLDYWSASNEGVLVYRTGGASLNRQFTWLDRQGNVIGAAGEPGTYETMKLSPDGKRVVFGRLDVVRGSENIFVMDLDNGSITRLTTDLGVDSNPIWSPDGRRVAWGRAGKAGTGIFARMADGSGPEERLIAPEATKFPTLLTDWTSDGRYVLSFGPQSAQQRDIWAMPVGGGPAVAVVETEANEIAGAVSPDGRWIAYRSNQSGQSEIHVQPFRPSSRAHAAPGGNWKISRNGSPGVARWSRDGKELIFLSRDGAIMSAAVTTGPNFSAATPKPLFQLPRRFMALSATPGSFIDPARDHQRFLVELPVVKTPRDELTVVLNWTGLMKP